MHRLLPRAAHRVAFTLLLAALTLVATPGRAVAHGALVATEPAAGASIAGLDRIVLRFAEPVATTECHLWLEGDDGVIPLGAPTTLDGDARTVVVTVPPVASGPYDVGYHVVGEDGDVVAGSFGFTFDAPPLDGSAPPTALTPMTVPAPGPLASASPRAPAADDTDHASVTRVLLIAAVALLLAGLAFLGVFARIVRPLRRPARLIHQEGAPPS